MVILAWALLWAPVYSDSTSDPAVYPLRDYFFSMLFRRCQGDVCDQPRQLMSNKEKLMAAVKELWDRGYRVDKPYSTANCRSWIGYKCSTEDVIKAGWSSYADDASEIVNDCRHTCRVPGYKTPPKWHDPNEWDFFNFGMR